MDGEPRSADVMEINRPDSLGDVADLGLTLAEAKLLLASVQREITTRKRGTTRFGGRVALVATVFAA